MGCQIIFNDLHLALKGVPEGFKILGDEILKLAQEKLLIPINN